MNFNHTLEMFPNDDNKMWQVLFDDMYVCIQLRIYLSAKVVLAENSLWAIMASGKVIFFHSDHSNTLNFDINHKTLRNKALVAFCFSTDKSKMSKVIVLLQWSVFEAEDK